MKSELLSLINELRKQTGAGVVDCKRALLNTGVRTIENIRSAVDFLRKEGVIKAANRNTKQVSEGVVCVNMNSNGASIIELNSETDFVSCNIRFRELARLIASSVTSDVNVDIIKKIIPAGRDNSIEYEIQACSAVLNENIVLRRVDFVDNEGGEIFVTNYVHNNGLHTNDDDCGNIAAVVGIKCDMYDVNCETVARKLAMHIVATSPQVISRDLMDEELMRSEYKIAYEQALKSGKSEDIVAQIANGMVNKWLKNIVLLEQDFVSDASDVNNVTVGEILKKNGIVVKKFVVYKVGVIS